MRPGTFPFSVIVPEIPDRVIFVGYYGSVSRTVPTAPLEKYGSSAETYVVGSWRMSPFIDAEHIRRNLRSW